MKTDEMVDALLESQNSEIVIELPNGQRIPSKNYIHDTNKKGEHIIVIRCKGSKK